jgi:sialic acid synthase SpsE
MSVKLIAELCQNHNGDFKMVKDMVDAAVDNGATHVKIQHIHVRNLTFRSQFEEGAELDGKKMSIKRPFTPEYARLKGLELSKEESKEFVAYVKSKGAIPMTTCFSRDSIQDLVEEGYESVKVASYDCASYQLLRELADNFKEVIVSTGATFNNEIEIAANVLREKGVDYTMLHCVTIYPTPLSEMHLAKLEWLKNFSAQVGFSDHSLVERDGVLASKAAIASGAEVIERHFTILEKDETKDGPVSIKPIHMKELADFAKLSKEEQAAQMEKEMPNWKEELHGDVNRKLSDAELLNREYYRGRFASPRVEGENDSKYMIFNWEETSV